MKFKAFKILSSETYFLSKISYSGIEFFWSEFFIWRRSFSFFQRRIFSWIFGISGGSRKLNLPFKMNRISLFFEGGIFSSSILISAWIFRLSSKFFTQMPLGSKWWIISIAFFKMTGENLFPSEFFKESGARMWNPLLSRLSISFEHASNSSSLIFCMLSCSVKCW